ncbi:MAG: VOC family protein [Burkholderiales bacterium]
MQTIGPCLWFNGTAEAAVNFYVALFENAKLLGTTRYPEGLPGKAGEVMSLEFELAGEKFLALNAGPEFGFTPAISFAVQCDTQAEVDRLWEALSAGGVAMPCGWVTDRFGVTWQVVPRMLPQVFKGPDGPAKQRAIAAMMQMTKLEIAPLERALRGE